MAVVLSALCAGRPSFTLRKIPGRGGDDPSALVWLEEYGSELSAV
jgi:hypothetical protein